MRHARLDPATIPGWGVDADPDNDPTYPMRDRSHEDKGGRSWERPPLQARRVEVLQSLEYDSRPAVFGTSTPPRGLSGAIRRRAFRYSEAEWAHWFMLLAADRVNVVEGVVEDFSRGRVPNIPAEMGLRAELAHNRAGFARKVAVSGAVLAVGWLALQVMAPRREGRR